MDTTRWWTVVQAVAWIIWRSLHLVERAAGIRTFAALQGLQELRPVSVGDDPPISLEAAIAELNRAIRDGRVGLSGRWRGSGQRVSAAMRGHLQTPWLADRGNEVRLHNEPMARTGDYWGDLWVRSNECMKRWQADPAADAASPPSIPATATRSATPPTYAPDVKYSPAKVPEEFKEWARAQHEAGVIITTRLAEDAMRGPQDRDGNRPGGLLQHGTGLSRDTIRAWVKNLLPSWYAPQGIPPSRRGAG